jgi:hypothetical protein
MKIWSDGHRMATLSCLKTKSANTKTGDMVQLSVLPVRETATSAIKNKRDSLICGDCPLKASLGGPCYVNPVSYNAPQKAYSKRKVETPSKLNKPLRLGAYGDPGFIPLKILEDVTSKAKGHTGYTHQWHKIKREYRTYLMASIDHIDNGQTKAKAKALGYRTFRILKQGDTLDKGEILCPNSTHGIQCADCLLCAGTSKGAKDIAIMGHGAPSKAKQFK